MTMNEITRSLDYWLRQNGLSTEGATLTITLSSKTMPTGPSWVFDERWNRLRSMARYLPLPQATE